MDLTREFNGQLHRKSSFSGAGNDCVYINRDLTAVADSKGGVTLPVGRAALLALTAHLR